LTASEAILFIEMVGDGDEILPSDRRQRASPTGDVVTWWVGRNELKRLDDCLKAVILLPDRGFSLRIVNRHRKGLSWRQAVRQGLQCLAHILRNDVSPAFLYAQIVSDAKTLIETVAVLFALIGLTFIGPRPTPSLTSLMMLLVLVDHQA
jgi:hypothetical protein